MNGSAAGLTSNEAIARLRKYGFNEFQKAKKIPWLKLLFAQFSNLLVLLLIIAGSLALLFRDWPDAIVLFAIVLLNALIGFFQEFKAERVLFQLLKYLPSYAKVVRDGKILNILSREIVVGDLLVLEPGMNVPADAELLEAFELKTNDFALTGESNATRRFVDAKEPYNQIFMGTAVATGDGRAIVKATGLNTEFGKIAKETEAINAELSPLQKNIRDMGKTIAKIALVVLILAMLVGYLFLDNHLLDNFLFALALAAAVVPEGLPAATSLALALAASRLLKQNALTRRLAAVETLGAVTVIATDKTGTLTENKMTVEEDFEYQRFFNFSGLHLISRFCNNAHQLKGNQSRLGRAQTEWIGDPLEIALMDWAKNASFSKLKIQRIFELPFDSQRKMMSVMVAVLNKNRQEYFLLTKGAIDDVLAKTNLSASERQKMAQKADAMAKRGLRVLSFAYRQLKHDPKEDIARADRNNHLEQELNFIGFLGLSDPPRKGVLEAIKSCRAAGIRVIMVTGDYSTTASVVAQRIGLVSEGEHKVKTGEEIDKMSDTALKNQLRHEVVFARVSPSHKLRIVTLLQEMGETVAVTGDGVNDALALKKADIGVAMGKTGTDVAREASDIVLLDDHFATIVAAVKEGRTIFRNIKKIVRFVCSGNVGELATIVIGLVIGIKALPILAIQILAIDLGAGVLPALALGVDPPHQLVMSKKPRDKKISLLPSSLLKYLISIGLFLGVGAVFAFLFTLYASGWHWRELIETKSNIYFQATIAAYSVLGVSELLNALFCHFGSEKFNWRGFLENKWLLFSILGSAIFVSAMVYFPPFQTIFRSAPFPPVVWFFAVIWTILFLFVAKIARKKFES